MKSDYMIVHRSILPDYYEKVIETRKLLAENENMSVTEAVKQTGISRNTWYKYKDYVFDPEENTGFKKAVISLILDDESGALSSVINELSRLGTSILTISQSLPVQGKANVMISLDTADMACASSEMIRALKKIKPVRAARLEAFE